MRDELDKLRPEVREALRRITAPFDPFIADSSLSTPGSALHDARVVSVELLRLAKENRILEVKNAGTLANNLCPDHRDKQDGHRCLACLLERAEAELDALKNLQYELAAQVTRANNAEAELAALKARIAAALLADVRRAPSGLGRVEAEGLPYEWIGKRVRLVVEE